jgi:hypothetical protein
MFIILWLPLQKYKIFCLKMKEFENLKEIS